MNETINIISQTTNRILSEKCDDSVRRSAMAGNWQADLWQALEESGLTTATGVIDEDGLPLASSMAILREIGGAAAPVPVAETMLASWILSRCGMDVPAGPLTVAPVLRGSVPTLSKHGEWSLTANMPAVPWARDAKHLVILCRKRGILHVALVPTEQATIIPGANMAGEPRDRVVFDNLALDPDWLSPATIGVDQNSIWFRGALMRVVLMDGTLETILQLVVNYCKERVQFGRPIGKFQAVQQQLSVLAGHVAAGNAAASAAVVAAETGPAYFEIAASKARISEAATQVSSIAHQLYGAAGFSHEFPLHHYTKRMWSWREEFGDETQWWDWLGRTVADVGGDNLWPLLTAEYGPLLIGGDVL